MTPPRATLRLQLHAGYTLEHAATDLPYFSRLGVSHLYLSPVSQAAPDSTHGYDVVDHTRVDTERGGEAALRALATEARERGMGLLLDIVPNHMATHPDNAWWWDVLENGPGSRWAEWFDIDWKAPALEGRVLAPFLDKPYEDALRAGDIRLCCDEPEAGAGAGADADAGADAYIAAHGVPYPVAPGSLDLECGIQQVLAAHDPDRADGRERLHELLERQHYRLAAWQRAADLINWRRFFEVSGLIGVRVEHEEVFKAVHELPLRLYAEGVVDGLRVDHVDGLALPLAYCRRLRAALAKVAPVVVPAPAPVTAPGPALNSTPAPWVVVEKILAPGEVLDDRWEVSGTTGYDFAADVGGLLHAQTGVAPLSAQWARVARDERPVAEWLVQARQTLLDHHFVAERGALLDALYRLAREEQSDGDARGWSREQMGLALDALLRHYPVYRSYVERGARHATDQRWFDHARQAALAEPAMQQKPYPVVLDWLDEVLGTRAPRSADTSRSAGTLRGADTSRAIQRFQQLTPPLAAKALEDTVFYRYGRLLSRNEVGSDPEIFSVSVEDFHRANLHRAHAASRGLLATATHDHKRGEDVRARLAVVSEIPDEWGVLSDAWMQWGEGRERVPPVIRYMLLQMLVGAWPPGLSAADPTALDAFLKRLGDWLAKALREGKQFSSWFQPDLSQEQASLDFLFSLGSGRAAQAILADIEAFVRRIEIPAVANGLMQTALRLTCPGIPDLYQGTEFRDFSLVDPDNRRPVDFAERARALDHSKAHPFSEAASPADAWLDGRVKQALIARLLNFRRDHPQAFEGGYTPLDITGAAREKAVAYQRGDDLVVIAAVKCAAQMVADESGCPRLPKDFWGDTRLVMPISGTDLLNHRQGVHPETEDAAARQNTDLSHKEGARLSDLLAGFPLVVFYRDQG